MSSGNINFSYDQTKIHSSVVTLFAYCSNFEDIFDVDWFMSTLLDDLHILKELPKNGPKVYTMRVPRKCNERCYEKRVLPVIMKRHVSLQISC